jgi:ribosomal protein S18 acetylase RimI-like enzyme
VDFRVETLREGDRDWLRQSLAAQWGSSVIVSRGRVHRADRLPGFLALDGDRRVGYLLFRVDEGQLEVVALSSLVERRGVGTALLSAAAGAAREASCRRLWLVTTNDNTPAMRFYERRGFSQVAVHEGVVTAARRLKPEIPLTGVGGAPLRDEVEFEIVLAGRR